jgi:hypothetical protein
MNVLFAVGFITWVSKSTHKDHNKLKQLLECIHGTMDLEYILGADHLKTMTSWVIASYVVHPDIRSHNGGMMSFGRAGIGCKPTKHKINVKSLTEAKIVGVSKHHSNSV